MLCPAYDNKIWSMKAGNMEKFVLDQRYPFSTVESNMKTELITQEISVWFYLGHVN